jgi:hypothetical protein
MIIDGSRLRAMSGLRGIVLAVRFLCELGMLAGLAIWGAHAGEGVWSVVLAIAAPLAAAVIWGAFVAPKARWPVPPGRRVAIELVLFGLASTGLWSTGRPALAVALAALGLATSVLNAATDPRRTR